MWMTLGSEHHGKPWKTYAKADAVKSWINNNSKCNGWMDDGCMDDVQHHNISYNPRKVYCTPEHLVIKEHDFRGMKRKMMHALYGILK